MKTALISLLALTASAPALATEWKVMSGNCRGERTRDIIEIKNVDPNMHFGMFAEGYSKLGDRIYLARDSADTVLIEFQSKAASSYSVIRLSPNGETQIQTGLYLRRDGQEQSEWLSCDLTIR